MKPISIYSPTSVEEAIQILSHHGREAAVYAGGTDLLMRLKNRIKMAPTYLVDIKKISDLRFIRETPGGGLSIGTLTTVTEVAESKLVQGKYSLLPETMREISAPELRNSTTLGGDLLQQVWCQYFRENYPCWRNGGYLCYGAIGDNSYYHSAMGGRLCYASYPGDAAIALLGLDAKVRVATPSGTKEMTIEQLIPGGVIIDGVVQSHALRNNEILTEVMLGPPEPGLRGAFEKARPRGVWDFAMASVAVVIHPRNGVINDARVVYGGIAVKPLRERAVEDFLRGKALSDDLVKQASSVALRNAAPLKYNGYKIDVAKGLLASALTKLSASA